MTGGPPAPEAGGPGAAVSSGPPAAAVPVEVRVGLAGRRGDDGGPGSAGPRAGDVGPGGAGAEIEELGGGPPVAPRPIARVSWVRAARAAATIAVERAPVRVLGLLAFLARGGIVLLALPIWVAPTVIGIANWVSPTSVTVAGPTTRLVLLVAAVVAAGALVILAGALIGGAAEAALHRATAAPGDDDPGAGVASLPNPSLGARGALRVAAIRLVLVVPVAAALVLAVPPLFEAGYREVTFPSDLRTPLVLRIFLGAPVASWSIVVAWLLAEVVGGLASRRAILLAQTVPRALAAALLDLVRRPGTTLLTLVAGLVGSALLIVPGLLAVGVTWDQAQRTLGEGAGFVAELLVAIALAGTWIGTLVLAGLAAAWRAALWTCEVLRVEGIRPPDA